MELRRNSPKTNSEWRPFSFLAIFCSLAANVGVADPLVTLGCAPLAFISGGIAIRKGFRTSGWVGVALGSAAIITSVYLFYHWGWFSPQPND